MRGDASDSLCILISTMLHFSNWVCFLHIINILYSFSLQIHHLNRKAFSSAIPIQFKDALQAWDKILLWCKTVQLCCVRGSHFLLRRWHFCLRCLQKRPWILPGVPLTLLPSPKWAQEWVGSSRNGAGAENRHHVGCCGSRFLLQLKVSYPSADSQHSLTTDKGSNLENHEPDLPMTSQPSKWAQAINQQEHHLKMLMAM